MTTSINANQIQTKNYNLFELRHKNLAAVTHAIQALGNTDPHKAENHAEAFITTAFHQAAMETAWRREVLRNFYALSFAVNSISAIDHTIRFIANYGYAPSVFSVAVVGIGLVGAAASSLAYAASRAEEKHLRNQINVEEGYSPYHNAWGHKTVYKRAERKIDTLIARAHKQANTATLEC